MSPDGPDLDPDDLLTRITELLATDPADPADPFAWTDAMVWTPDEFRAPDGRVFLDMAGWVV